MELKLKIRYFITSLICLFVLASMLSCTGKNNQDPLDDNEQVQTYYHPQTMASKPVKSGDHVLCPVSGIKITVSDKTPFSEYEGKKIYLANENSKTKFDADPEGFMLSPVDDLEEDMESEEDSARD